MRYDTVVVGAGMGGLISAALLRKRKPNESLLVLESHTVSGGCASYFDRFVRLPGSEVKTRIRLDVGATTISGLEPNQPLGLILNELGIVLPVHQADPGVRVVLHDGTEIMRHADRVAWIAESRKIFGEATVGFWEDIHTLSGKAWSLLGDFLRFPPASISDLVSSLNPSLLRAFGLLPSLLQPMQSLLKRHGLDTNDRFVQFVNQQLLISVQNTMDDVPTLLGALALDYPSETYYVDGGLYTLIESLEQFVRNSGSEVRHKKRVVSIKPNKDGFEITTEKGLSIFSQRVVCNLTMWDMPSVIQSAPQKFVRWTKRHQRSAGPKAWGAIDLYGCIRDTFDDRGALYHQIHSQSDDGGKYSVFLSLSRRGDKTKAPDGWRSFSCSTHEANPERWFAMTASEETMEREKAQQRIERLLQLHVPGYATAERALIEVSTPYHFQFYTGRKDGRVGGVPHSMRRPLFFWPVAQTPINGIFMVGDTVFPGQGTSGIAHGARCLLDRIG
jgi:phytoene dehydrogenase-like protein